MVRFFNDRLTAPAGRFVVPVFLNDSITHCVASDGITVIALDAPLQGYGKLHLLIGDEFTFGGVWVACGDAFAVLYVRREITNPIVEVTATDVRINLALCDGWVAFHVDSCGNKNKINLVERIDVRELFGHLLFTNGFIEKRVDLACLAEPTVSLIPRIEYQRGGGVCLTIECSGVTKQIEIKLSGDFEKIFLIEEDVLLRVMNHNPFVVEKCFTFIVNSVHYRQWVRKPEKLPTHLLPCGENKWRFNIPCAIAAVVECGDISRTIAANTSMFVLPMSGSVRVTSVASDAVLFEQNLPTKFSLPTLRFANATFTLERISKQDVLIWFKGYPQPLTIAAGHSSVLVTFEIHKDVQCFVIEQVEGASFASDRVCLLS